MSKYVLTIIVAAFITSFSEAQIPNYYSDKLETAADLGKYQAIGLSVSKDNRVFVSFPRKQDNYEYGLTEIVNGERKPYPNKEWNENTEGFRSFASIQDLYVDKDDFLWVLDSKPAGSKAVLKEEDAEKEEGDFKLLKINLDTDEVEKMYTFDDLDKTETALNDVRIDTDKNLAYFSDPGLAAIVVLDLETEKTRVLLQDSKVTKAENDVVLSYQGHEMRDEDGDPFKSDINGIALTHDNRFFYFKPINGYSLYRIQTKNLADTDLSDGDLMDKVEKVANTVITHGLIADENGNVYLTSSTDYSVKYVSPDGKLHTLVQDKRILWPDSMGIGRDGYLYFSTAQIMLGSTWNDGEDKTKYPYRVYRVKLPES